MKHYPASHVIDPLENHSSTILLLHGRDSEAEEFAAEFFESQASDKRYIRDVCPEAPRARPAMLLLYFSQPNGYSPPQNIDMQFVTKQRYRSGSTCGPLRTPPSMLSFKKKV